MKQTALVVGGIVGAIVVGAIAIYLFMPLEATVPAMIETPHTVEATQPTSVLTSNPDTTQLRTAGSKFQDPQNRYSFYYPTDYQLDIQDSEHIRLVKRGATQQGQTELYDGALIVFEPLTLKGSALEGVVNTRIQNSLSDGTSETLQPKKAIILNGHPGFSYELRGLGSSTYLVIQKTPTSNFALSITFMVSDPEDVGYHNTVEEILATVELQQ